MNHLYCHPGRQVISFNDLIYLKPVGGEQIFRLFCFCSKPVIQKNLLFLIGSCNIGHSPGINNFRKIGQVKNSTLVTGDLQTPEIIDGFVPVFLFNTFLLEYDIVLLSPLLESGPGTQFPGKGSKFAGNVIQGNVVLGHLHLIEDQVYFGPVGTDADIGTSYRFQIFDKVPQVFGNTSHYLEILAFNDDLLLVCTNAEKTAECIHASHRSAPETLAGGGL